MRQKSVLDMVNNRLAIIDNDRNDVETGINIQFVPKKIGVCGIDQSSLFLLVYGKIGLAIIAALACLHLHDDQFLAVFCDDVDLLMTVPPIAFEDFVALIHEILHSDFLALFSKIDMFCHN